LALSVQNNRNVISAIYHTADKLSERSDDSISAIVLGSFHGAVTMLQAISSNSEQ
jgi:hypothetical protein